MSCNRFVDFEKGHVPSHEDVSKVLADYLGAFLVKSSGEGNRRFAQLIGHKSWPFRQLESEDSVQAEVAMQEAEEERWIEIYISEDSVNVITHHQDEATMRLADGFAELVARYWKGEIVTDT